MSSLEGNTSGVRQHGAHSHQVAQRGEKATLIEKGKGGEKIEEMCD